MDGDIVYRDYISNVSECLQNVEANLSDYGRVSVEQAFSWLADESFKIKLFKQQMFLIGNGASAAMSSHTAADIWKNFQIKSHVFTDMASSTAVSNDLSYEKVYSEPLSLYGDKGDMLVCISSSGESPNILKSCEVAHEKGLTIVTMSAMKPSNRLRRQGHLNLYVPAETYGLAEVCHQTLLHFWIDNMESMGSKARHEKPKPASIDHCRSGQSSRRISWSGKGLHS